MECSILKNKFIIGLVILFISCKDESVKPENELPPFTAIGADKIGFLIGDNPITITSRDIYPYTPTDQFITFYGYMLEEKLPTDFIRMTFWDFPRKLEERYYDYVKDSLDVDIEIQLDYNDINQNSNDNATCWYFSMNVIDGGVEVVRNDRSSRIISGLFEFQATISYCDTVRIRKGRFDVIY